MFAVRRPPRNSPHAFTEPAKVMRCIYCAILLAVEASAQPKEPPTTLPELQQRLAAKLSQPKYAAASWGVKIVSLDSGRTLFEQNPQKLCTPASNSKLYTVALALDRLGADYQIQTSLYSRAKPASSGTLAGDLIVYGRGDPTITARLHGGSLWRALESLVAALTNAGVKQITGDLVADASYFHGPPFGSGWLWDDLEHAYGAEISALTINDNIIEALVTPGPRAQAPCRITLSPPTVWLSISNSSLTAPKGGKRELRFYRPLGENVIYLSGEMPVDDAGFRNEITFHSPAGLFVSWFRQALARHGIQVGGKLRTVSWRAQPADSADYSQWVELGSIKSPPMRDLAREVLKPSQNLYADLLLAHLGERTRTPDDRSGASSEELGIRELNQFLAKAGIKPGESLFEEGSGLSRNNLTTPNATVALLRFMSRHTCADVYRSALPIAGVDGTLKGRMQNTPAAGNARAKTGTLRWANSVSGFVTTEAGEHLVFSLMLNRYAGPAAGQEDLDAIVVMLASFRGRTTD